jgi:hypothetical protein
MYVFLYVYCTILRVKVHFLPSLLFMKVLTLIFYIRVKYDKIKP